MWGRNIVLLSLIFWEKGEETNFRSFLPPPHMVSLLRWKREEKCGNRVCCYSSFFSFSPTFTCFHPKTNPKKKGDDGNTSPKFIRRWWTIKNHLAVTGQSRPDSTTTLIFPVKFERELRSPPIPINLKSPSLIALPPPSPKWTRQKEKPASEKVRKSGSTLVPPNIEKIIVETFLVFDRKQILVFLNNSIILLTYVGVFHTVFLFHVLLSLREFTSLRGPKKITPSSPSSILLPREKRLNCWCCSCFREAEAITNHQVRGGEREKRAFPQKVWRKIGRFGHQTEISWRYSRGGATEIK